jgi:hypothetical protein
VAAKKPHTSKKKPRKNASSKEPKAPQLIADAIGKIGTQEGEKLSVTLSNELVQLLSEQLYQSPLKAIEELVVNAYDAAAKQCRVFVPSPSDQKRRFVVTYDNGFGMDYNGLVDLWQIGRSNKRTSEVEHRANRKQIGKFGIGKLATYTIANKITYLTRTKKTILGVTLDFREFVASSEGATQPVRLTVRSFTDWSVLSKNETLALACEAARIDLNGLFTNSDATWTIAFLEDLKPKAEKIQLGNLQRVLRTAMPLKSDFRLFLNGQEISSSKERYDVAVEFDIKDLPEKRLKALKDSSGVSWQHKKKGLFSSTFPNGVFGNVIVVGPSSPSLLGKSSDLSRSHGFFIKVRGRLINEEDALFGVPAKSFQTYNRFRADLEADDLDQVLTAPREGVEASTLKTQFQALLEEIFNEARGRYVTYLENADKGGKTKKETDRDFVSPRLVEHPVAEVLSVANRDGGGAEADDSWFYLDVDQSTNVQELVRDLYNQPRTKYKYEYVKRGSTKRLVRFSPSTFTFELNQDHDLVRAYDDDARARLLLHDIATAEALLEVYLRESDVPFHIVGEVLERRDVLLRSLAQDHPYSLKAVADALRDSGSDQYDLEIHLVAAARALGFVAKHISGGGQPDGIARFTDYPAGEKKITLEAKSSQETPQLSALDIAGLQEHMNDKTYQADGCLVIAPSYPGSTKKERSAVSKRANAARVSCWTIEQLARVVEAAESRHFNARHVLDIVLKSFSPEDVTAAIENLFAESQWNIRDLYRAILAALRDLEGRTPDSPRNLGMLSAEVSRRTEFSGIKAGDIEKAVSALAASSQGGLTFTGDQIILHVSTDEIERRLTGLTKQPAKPMRTSRFKDGN